MINLECGVRKASHPLSPQSTPLSTPVDKAGYYSINFIIILELID